MVTSRWGFPFSVRAAALCLLACTASAQAQDIQGFKPAVGAWNYLSIDGGNVAEVGRFVPSTYISYSRNPLVLRDDNGDVEDLLVENLTMVHLLLAVGLHERVEVGVDIPFGYADGSDQFDIDKGAGLGDIRLLPKFIILGAGGGQGFGLGIATPLSFPTGDADKTSRQFVANPKLLAEYRGDGWRAAANGGYRWRPTNRTEPEPLTVGNGITYGAAASVDLGTPDLVALIEGYGTYFTDVAEDEGGPTPLEALAGLRLFNDLGLVFTLSGGVGVIPDFGAPEFRVLGGLAWMRRPDEPQPVMVASAAPIAAASGPDGDRDGDGVKDSVDACPDLPEDRDGFEDTDGCPDIDNDGDGIVDADDRCPNHPEDLDGFQDEDGCPDLDNDGDGIADASDLCPMLPENRNGHEDTDGCPDEADVMVTAGSIQILKNVYFDTQRARLREESRDILEQVAQVLKSNPAIKRVRIEGHTDATGPGHLNVWLGRERATQVLEFLVRQGVERHRLEAVGYSSQRPVGDGRSADAAQLSRRVEFTILDRTDLPPVVEPSSPPPPPPPPVEAAPDGAD